MSLLQPDDSELNFERKIERNREKIRYNSLKFEEFFTISS